MVGKKNKKRKQQRIEKINQYHEEKFFFIQRYGDHRDLHPILHSFPTRRSSDLITNTAMAFMATLERIKIAGDQSNISGVNHSVLHGFNYSPPEATFPGWVRYGTYFNENNTWWPYFRNWSDYKARISYLLQQAIPQANVAILQPLTDLWMKYGPQRDPFPSRWYPKYQNNLWEAVHQNGGACDYVSENIINKSTFEKGEMIYNGRRYSALLLPEIETL